MGFGGENMGASALCPMIMMPLLTTTSHHHNNPTSLNPIIFNANPTNNLNYSHSNYPNPNPNADTHSTNVIQLPPPCTTNTDKYHPPNPNNHTTINTSTGLGYYMEIGPNLNNHGSSSSSSSSTAVKAKIMAHPHYHRLLSAYVNCQKVGAPPEVVARLEEACASAVGGGGQRTGGCSVGEDPALDQFMEAYCEMLVKYQQELSKPFNDAMLFLHRIDSQFKSLTISPSSHFAGDDATDRNGSPEDDVDVHNNMIDPQAEDRELKGQLLRKYSGYLGSLKQEFMKKRKKGKLPKEARQQLLEWWSRHYKWPYPSESQKLALAESTGLDQKQINNWFINQRKRHWKPSEDMQFVVMDPTHPHYYMDNVMGANPFPMDLSHTML